MFVLKLFGFLCLVSQVLCEKRLLIDQLRWDFLHLEKQLWNIAPNESSYKEHLIVEFYQFDQKIKQISEKILERLDPLRQIPDFIFLYSKLQDIDNKYDKFREYQQAQITKSYEVPMKNIIADILNDNVVKRVINKVFDIAFERQGSIGEQLPEMTNDDFWCKNYELSPQQLFYNLYNVISLRELKAYVMLQFAYLGIRVWNTGNHTKLSNLTRYKFERRANKITQFGIGLKKASVDIWRCDPKDYVQGKTYDQFTRLLQGHIQNVVDMSPDRSCERRCEDYSSTKSYGCYDSESDFCKKAERCNGRIRDCRLVDAHATICLASSWSPRRYDYVHYDNGVTYGRNQYCSVERRVDSWMRWLFQSCHYCMCLCDEHGSRSDRYINLRPVMADTQHNRVVTGLRLVKHNRMLHLQIQEGKLLPYGYINESTVHWAPVDDYKITDQGVISGEDFFTMTYEHRSMALDESEVHEDNYVVTGVRFESIDHRVHFKIHASPFNWNTGTIQTNHGHYIKEISVKGRSQICLSQADIPVMTNTPSTMNFSRAHVEFTHTDYCKDAAQTTIPFIDIQEVINTPAVPLMGAGIYYKGTVGYGGFIAPKIKTYDFGRHI